MLKRINLTLWILFSLICRAITTEGKHFVVTKAECTSLDPKFSYFKSCEMKTDERGRTKINYYVAMRYKEPVTDVTLKLTLFKISKAYRIPIFNETLDFCAFMRQSLVTKMLSLIASHYKKFTNANHSCPYQHDIIFNGVDNEQGLTEIPAPKGNYILQLRIGAFQKWKADVKIFLIQN